MPRCRMAPSASAVPVEPVPATQTWLHPARLSATGRYPTATSKSSPVITPGEWFRVFQPAASSFSSATRISPPDRLASRSGGTTQDRKQTIRPTVATGLSRAAAEGLLSGSLAGKAAAYRRAFCSVAAARTRPDRTPRCLFLSLRERASFLALFGSPPFRPVAVVRRTRSRTIGRDEAPVRSGSRVAQERPSTPLSCRYATSVRLRDVAADTDYDVRRQPSSQDRDAADGKTSTTTLSILTYNIEGLGWPARRKRADRLRQIGEKLAELRQRGQAPDVVLFQEMFSGAAKKAVAASGYPAIVTGPRRTTQPPTSTRTPLPGTSSLRRGELGIHLTGSGLAVASRYPITYTEARAYGRRSCAGIDCLSNKGIVLARIVVPGVPTPIDIYNTHMNARGASRAPAARSAAAHDRQSLEASEFIDRTHDDASPVIFGGDFNMRHSEERWSNFSRYQSLALVHRVCAEPASQCDVRVSLGGDAPWMNTQDLQLFWRGDRVSITPIRVEAMFDGSAGQPALSDHDGLLVTYQLRWPTRSSSAGC